MLAVDSLPSAYRMPLPDNADSLGAWLSDLQLAQYTALFIQHGFTSLDSVKGLYGLELDKVLLFSAKFVGHPSIAPQSNAVHVPPKTTPVLYKLGFFFFFFFL